MYKKKINILDLRDSPWVDGPGRTILQCSEDLRKDNFDVFIGSFSSGLSDGSAYESEALERGLNVIRINENSSLDLRPIKQVVSLIRQLDIDMIHSHDFRSTLIGFLAAKLTNIPIITTVHGWIANDYKSALKNIIDKWFIRHVDHVIFVSHATRSILGNKINKSKYTIIPNCLKIEQYKVSNQSGCFRKEFSIKDDEIIIAHIGRLSPEKGQILFLQAAKTIVSINSNVKFLIIGKGPDKCLLESTVKELGIENHVLFTGFRNDMPDVYQDINLVVQSSYTEGMPNVILEALLLKTPVIATNVGGTSEIISHGKTGLLLSPGDLPQLIQYINDFLIDQQALRNMAINGSAVIKNHFNHQDRVKIIKDLYLNLLYN
jgi:glycosyltransferase involved in cell wall biosynthesis